MTTATEKKKKKVRILPLRCLVKESAPGNASKSQSMVGLDGTSVSEKLLMMSNYHHNPEAVQVFSNTLTKWYS